jgi:hypothetical protein
MIEDNQDLVAALIKAQTAFPSIKKNRTAQIKTEKGTYSYRYADLADILSEVTPILLKQGLALSQCFDVTKGGELLLITRLLHTSGQSLSSALPLHWSGARMQELGAQITYLRRYALAAILGIAAEEDTDAREAAAYPRQDGTGQPDTRTITEKQRKRLYAIGKSTAERLQVPDEQIDEYAKRFMRAMGIESSKDLTKESYDALCSKLDALTLTDLAPQAYEEGEEVF